MKIQVANNYTSAPKTNFKSLIFHDNAREIITKGDKNISKEVSKNTRKLSKTKDFDLHIKPIGNDNVFYYWTKKGGDKPIMECSIATYKLDTHDNKVGIYAMNPYGYGEDDFCAVLEYENKKAAQKAYDTITGLPVFKRENTVERLTDEVNSTLEMEKANKMSLKTFRLWEKVKEDMPQGDKFEYGYVTPEHIEKAYINSFQQQEPDIIEQTEKKHTKKYGLKDRLRILVGLEPKKEAV